MSETTNTTLILTNAERRYLAELVRHDIGVLNEMRESDFASPTLKMAERLLDRLSPRQSKRGAPC